MHYRLLALRCADSLPLTRWVIHTHPCFRNGNVIFPIRDDSMNSSFFSQTPKKRERINHLLGVQVSEETVRRLAEQAGGQVEAEQRAQAKAALQDPRDAQRGPSR